MKPVKYAQSIHCRECEGSVRMMNGRLLAGKGPARVEIDYTCVECGTWGTAAREEAHLPYSEREFCYGLGILRPEEKTKGQGVYITRNR